MDATNNAVPDEFAGLRKLAEAAHPGPWRAGATSLMAPETDDHLEITLRASNGNRDVLRKTTRYFAAANPATILRLLDALAAAHPQPAAVSAPSDEPVAWMTEPTSAAHPSMRREVMFDKPQAVKADFTVTPLYDRAAAPVSGPTDAPLGEVILFAGDRDLKEVSWAKGKMPPVGTKLYSSAPVSGQGASIDTPEFRALLTAHAQHQNQVTRLNLIAHIDSRPRSEDSRAKVLEEAAQACDSRAENFQTSMTNAIHGSTAELARALRNEASSCALAIRALASTITTESK